MTQPDSEISVTTIPPLKEEGKAIDLKSFPNAERRAVAEYLLKHEREERQADRTHQREEQQATRAHQLELAKLQAEREKAQRQHDIDREKEARAEREKRFNSEHELRIQTEKNAAVFLILGLIALSIFVGVLLYFKQWDKALTLLSTISGAFAARIGGAPKNTNTPQLPNTPDAASNTSRSASSTGSATSTDGTGQANTPKNT